MQRTKAIIYGQGRWLSFVSQNEIVNLEFQCCHFIMQTKCSLLFVCLLVCFCFFPYFSSDLGSSGYIYSITVNVIPAETCGCLMYITIIVKV